LLADPETASRKAPPPTLDFGQWYVHVWNVPGPLRVNIPLAAHALAVEAPSQSGYGENLTCDLIPYELDGAVDLEFAPDGLRCGIEIPLKWMSGVQPIGLPNVASPIATRDAGSPAAPPR
jgi:hypothetical protein